VGCATLAAMDQRPLQPILCAWPHLDDGDGPQPAESLLVSRLSGGLINDTYALGRRFILQRLHPIFLAEVNLDIAALTPQLAAAGVPVPRLVLARSGQPWHAVMDAQTAEAARGVWRILTRLPGETRHRLDSPSQAEAAGQMVARFHTALRSCDHTFHFSRPGAHDTPAHLATLAQAVASCRDHPLHADVAALAEELQARWTAWGPVPELPQRIIHGDLKVSNLLFEGDAVCGVLDLDTMARSSLDIELGDALRSWCNRTTEDDPAPAFDLDTFAAAWRGYRSVAADWLTAGEQQSIPLAIERICLELSARFAADALYERYFGWDSQRYATRGAHNWARACNQLGLARDVHRWRAPMCKIVSDA
jgi:Ser/Thr protein kinase RdoA (MazF antagonist)